jgi:nucleoid DNA-binding protein
MALTQTQLADAIAEKADLTRADAKKALTALEEVILEQIGEAEKVKIGGVVQLTVRLKPARPRLAETLVEAVDHLRHRLESVGDHTKAVLAEVLGVDAERTREPLHHVVRGDGPVAVHEVVEVTGRQSGLVREAAVRRAGFVHQALDRRAERLGGKPTTPGH